MTDFTHAEVREAFEYDSSRGLLIWQVPSSRRVDAGDIAGVVSTKDGYRRIGFRTKRLLAHRLIWFWVYGKWPVDQLDHIDLDRSNDRVENLREATATGNNRNRRIGITNSSGLKGVGWHVGAGKWRARIHVAYVEQHLGLFDSKEEARAAYAAAAIRLHGEFARYD